METHLAEKLHAYTLPRERPNTRVKDLPDLALLGTPEWSVPYSRMTEQDSLPWRTLAEVEGAARGFLDPLPCETAAAMWEPTSWSWRPSSAD